jgi:hypothetical protein
MSASVSHPQITTNITLMETNDTTSVDRTEQRETNTQPEKSPSSHTEAGTTEKPLGKPISRNLHAYL